MRLRPPITTLFSHTTLFPSVVLKIKPKYSKYFNVKTLKDSLAKEKLTGKSRAEIYKMLWKRLDINDVDRVITKDDVVIWFKIGRAHV